MGYIVAARFHDQSRDLPYLAIGRTDGQFAAYVYLAEWDGVDGHFLRGFRSAKAAVGPDLDRTGNPENSGGQRKSCTLGGSGTLGGPLGSRSGTTSVSWAGRERLELG